MNYPIPIQLITRYHARKWLAAIIPYCLCLRDSSTEISRAFSLFDCFTRAPALFNHLNSVVRYSSRVCHKTGTLSRHFNSLYVGECHCWYFVTSTVSIASSPNLCFCPRHSSRPALWLAMCLAHRLYCMQAHRCFGMMLLQHSVQSPRLRGEYITVTLPPSDLYWGPPKAAQREVLFLCSLEACRVACLSRQVNRIHSWVYMYSNKNKTGKHE